MGRREKRSSGMKQRKTAVVYATRNGSTKRYAEWIARDCSADLIALEEADIDQLALYGTLVYGGCVYSGAIQGISFIKNNRDLLQNVRLVVFTVGLTQPGDEAAFAQVLDRNFTEEERRDIQFFHFPGALDHKKMSLQQRGIMWILKKSIQKKPKEARSQMEGYILESYGGKVDFTNAAYVKPLVRFVRSGSEIGEKT